MYGRIRRRESKIQKTKTERNFLLFKGFAWNDLCVRCWLWFWALRERERENLPVQVFCVTKGVTTIAIAMNQGMMVMCCNSSVVCFGWGLDRRHVAK